MFFAHRGDRRGPSRRGLATAIVLASALSACALASGSAWGTRIANGGGASIAIRKATSEVLATKSASAPHWACPNSLCEAIVDPQPVKVAGHYALPQGPQLEGGGEGGGYDPADLQSAYKIPTTGGSGQTVALVDAFGYSAAESDLAKYRERYGLPACTKASGCFERLNQKGEQGHYPKEGGSEEAGWQVESALDLDMVSAACPSCHIMLVEAENPYIANLGTAVNAAASAGATEISNSYGLPEQVCPGTGGECEEAASDYSHAGVAITVSAGDEGYDNVYEHASSPSYPADLPTVVSVGGTFLHKAQNQRGWSESVWKEATRKLGSGSGCSSIESKPAWQKDSACSHRIDNDVAAVGGCQTPVSVYIAAEGGFINVCGTSASSPLVAGILAHASEAVRSAGAKAFYEDPESLFDVTEGSNGTCTPPAEDAYFCTAQIGYDGPTGLGTPDGVPGLTLPTVTSVEPNAGPEAGGTSVTITGANLGGATEVRFGATKAASFEVNSATSITAVSPAEAAGTVDVMVTTPSGTSEPAEGDKFSYLAAPTITKVKPKAGPVGGGTTVTISGTNLTGATAVKFGTTSAASFKVNSATSITAVSPAESAGAVDVTVTTPAGTSPASKSDRFKFKPVVTALSPRSGPEAGGTSVTVTGAGFALGSATKFKFGTTKGTSVNCTSSTECKVTAPPHAAGTVDVKAIVNKQTSAKNAPSDQFTYS
jgi:IPT/TIG domain